MSSRIIVSRDVHGNGWTEDGYETQRAQLAAEIRQVAQDIAACWVLHTKSGDMIKVPVALRTQRVKDRRGRGHIEVAWMSRPRLIYPVQGWYDFGIDASGALYDRVYRRSMDFSRNVRFWVPMGDVESSRYSIGVLDLYLLPYLNDMAHH